MSGVSEDDIQRIAKAVAAVQEQLIEEAQERIAESVTNKVLITFGLDEDEPKDIRADFTHLRRWRKSVERVESVGWTAAITFVATGVLAALWLGIKASIGKP